MNLNSDCLPTKQLNGCSGRQPWPRWLTVLLLLAWAGLQLVGQETNSIAPGSEIAEPVDLSQTNDLAEPDASNTAAELSSTNQVGQTNSQSQASNRDGRSRRSRRQRQGTTTGAGGSVTSAALGSAASTNGANTLDYVAFKTVADRNIFNPNRQPSRPGAPRPKPKLIETFSLVGIMSYEKGTFAFFDGSSADYRKALKTNDSIAGYQLAAIDGASVKLALQTNTLELRVGAQMRREDEGVWLQLSQAEPIPASATSTTAASDPAVSGAESDVLKKLMQRREQE